MTSYGQPRLQQKTGFQSDMSQIRKKAVQGLQAGDSFSVSRRFMEEDVLQFADLSRDYNPVHFDERFAAAKKFASRICHGLLVGSLITEIGGQIGWLASGMSFRFIKPVYFGDSVRCDFTIRSVDKRGRAEAEALFTRDDGQVVATAHLTGVLPGEAERQVMREMVAAGDPTNKASR